MIRDRIGGTVDELPLTVVIATLGGQSLGVTVARLNSFRRKPAEILICIPADEAPKVAAFGGANTRVLVTPLRGQVAQRAEGLRQAKQPFVLQLDDDMDVAESDITLLLDRLRQLGPGNAVAPVYYDEQSDLCIHRQHDGLRGFLQSVNAVLAGAPWGVGRMGKVSPAGTNFGVDPDRCAGPMLETEWVPGGCVLHFREGLVTENFYPFPGKAFCEDLMHSHLLKSRGIRLWVVVGAKCRTSDPVIPADLRTIRADIRARRHFNRMRGGGSPRFWVWLAVSVARRQLARLRAAARSAA